VLAERVISSTNAKLVLDPFIGSGTVAVAAKKLGRNFIGIDKVPEYLKMAIRRLREKPLQDINTNSYRHTQLCLFKGE